MFGLSLSSPGNAPGIPVIEIYVDTNISVECKYEKDVVINADGFWINQEDVDISKSDTSLLADVAECKFYSDAAREKQISSQNIVNMGSTIYGEVDYSVKMGDLQFRLTDVVVSDGTPDGKSYSVIENSVPKVDVAAYSEGSAETGSKLDFSYLSFGFENLGHQNKVRIQCLFTAEPVADGQ